MLERLVYRSKAAGDMGSLSLFNLLAQARKRNAQLDITGHLIFDGEFFTQWVEGPSTALDALWQSLQKDERHREIMLITRTPIDQRRFSEWHMAFSSYASLNGENMPGFFPVDENTVSEKIKQLTE
jgi:hypothetical protein